MASRFQGRLPPLMREALAEFIATFILVSFGVGSVAQKVLSRGEYGTFFSINFGWGIGVTLGCYWAGGISGAHMNPAVTVAFAVVRRFAWIKVPVYCIAQFLGAFFASVIVYGIYYDALNAFDGGVRHVLGENGTAGIWATYPQPSVSNGTGFADQLFGTALLVSCIFAILDRNNNSPDKGVAPIMIGLVVFVIGATFGFNCGFAINPARDLGPRLFTAMAGWGGEVFTAANHWAWVPVIACPLGGVLGAFVYIFFIELHHPPTNRNDNDPNRPNQSVGDESDTEEGAANHWAWVPVIACPLGGVLGAFVYIFFIELHHPPTNRNDNDPNRPNQSVGDESDTEEGLLSSL